MEYFESSSTDQFLPPSMPNLAVETLLQSQYGCGPLRTMSTPRPAKPQTSERFCAPDADIVIRSFDKVLFKVHKNNLEMHSEVFPGEGLTTEEVVDIPESSAVLELLFQYMYRQPQPDLSLIPFETLAALAEAVEKYRVYPAIEVCKMFMKEAVSDHAMEVFTYAARHGYFNICDRVAPNTIQYSVDEALMKFGQGACLAWVSHISTIRISITAQPQCACFHIDQNLFYRLGIASNGSTYG